MNAGLLDVLHDAPDQNILAIANGIHVNFGGVIEKAVQQNRRVIRNLDRVAHVPAQFGFAMHDIHGAPAQHI